MDSKYLPHIDGIRAVSILLVILFHAGFDQFSGGFVGVDVFFVISGFLITGLIEREMREGGFSFKRFYLRRIKRLMPVYAFILAVSFPVFWIILLPEDLIYHGRLMVTGFLSLSNFYLANTSGGYFEKDVTDIPLVHTWSLAVEEQYYLLWPLFLLLLFKLGNSRLRLGILAVLLGGGIIYSEWQTVQDPTRAYYLLPARFFELMIGSLLALGAPYLPRLNKGMAVAAALVGLAAVILPALILSDDSRFPGFNALPVTLGAALLIIAGFSANPVSSLLSSRPFVGLGKISYSLYLWHWVIFCALFYTRGSLALWETGFAVALAVVLSILSWRYVENPIRFSSKLTGRRVVGLVYATPLSVFLAAGLVIDQGEGFVGRFGDRQEVVRALESRHEPVQQPCDDLGDGERCADVLLLGDSHAEHFSGFLQVLAEARGLTLDARTQGGCTPIFGVATLAIKDGQPNWRGHCISFIQDLLARSARYRYVVLAGYWSGPAIKRGRLFYADHKGTELSLNESRRLLEAGMTEGLEAIVRTGAIPVIIRDNPTFQKATLKCVTKQFLQYTSDSCYEPGEIATAQRLFWEDILSELRQRFPQLIVIDPLPIFCDSERCSAVVGGLPAYRDDDHLNGVGSAQLGKAFLERFPVPFENRL